VVAVMRKAEIRDQDSMMRKGGGRKEVGTA
jgi:hypothetical protein